jgi:hypothetical protein
MGHRMEQVVSSAIAAMLGPARDGECYYCRDGKRVRLFKYTRGIYSGGDFVPDDEYVCFSCYHWLDRQTGE